MRTFAAAVVVAALLGAPAAISAENGNYTPVNPPASTLSGSAVFASCLSGDPWIEYRVQVTDPPADAAADAVLVLGAGSRAVTVPLGRLANGTVSGRVPWPSDAFTDPATSATLRLEPQLADPLSVRLADPQCASAGVLAVTGPAGWLPLAGLAGAGLIAVGVLAALVRRRRES